jgi:hypothetical protein
VLATAASRVAGSSSVRPPAPFSAWTTYAGRAGPASSTAGSRHCRKA